MSQSPAYVVLCVLARLAKMSWRQVHLGGKFLCCVNASAPASTSMVRYAISSKRGTGTAGIKAKLAQQLAHLEQAPFYGVFLDLKKAFDSTDRERCLLILEGYGVGPRMIRLIRNYWRNAVLVCQASGNYGSPFCAGHGVTQGGPLSTKLFNILVDAVAREWVRQLWEESELEEAVITELITAFFAIFYVDNAYLASWDLEFLQRVLDILVDLFAHVGLETNVKKTQTMICMPGRIQFQLPLASYARMREGLTTAEEWDSWKVQCHQCNKMMSASSLCHHLADQHGSTNRWWWQRSS
jgi:hypothetical protein